MHEKFNILKIYQIKKNEDKDVNLSKERTHQHTHIIHTHSADDQ